MSLWRFVFTEEGTPETVTVAQGEDARTDTGQIIAINQGRIVLLITWVFALAFLGVLGTALWMSNNGREIPEYLWNIVLLITGYFGGVVSAYFKVG